MRPKISKKKAMQSKNFNLDMVGTIRLCVKKAMSNKNLETMLSPADHHIHLFIYTYSN